MISNILLIICTVLLILFFINYVLSNTFLINVKFYDKHESCRIFQKYHTKYFDNFNENEKRIKKCESNTCHKKYCHETKNFTDTEKNDIIFTLNKVKNIMKKNKINQKINFNNIFNNWKFIKVSNNIEDGMPHTVGDIIVLSQMFLDRLNKNINNEYELIKNQGTTFIHEYIHVMQKNNPNIFKKLYTDYWNFKFVVIDTQNYNILSNPDGLNNDLCFKLSNDTCVIPLITLQKSAKRISDFDKKGVLLKSNKIIDVKYLDDIVFQKYNDFFKNTDDNYHPNELSAGYISEILLNKYHNHNFNNEAIKKLITWMNKYFINL